MFDNKYLAVICGVRGQVQKPYTNGGYNYRT